MANAEKITFYIPKHLWPSPFPREKDFSWDGYKDGIYCWTLQTYFRLKLAGFDCELNSELPDSGIIAAHRGCLGDSMKPTKDQLLVCFQADWGRHPYYTPIIERFFMPGKRFFIRLWSQPGLLPRDGSRGNRIRKIAYLGRPENLAKELQTDAWDTFLNSLGIEWSIVSDPASWKDYRDIDATISIRSFEKNNAYHKPATKLYNSWVARVIPICFPESAYAAEQKSNYDCVMVKSYKQLKEAVHQLQNSSEERERFFARSQQRSNDVSVDFQISEWIMLINNKIIPEYYSWKVRSWAYRKLFFAIRGVGYIAKKVIGI